MSVPIVRYRNRKLYDKSASSYITVGEAARHIMMGSLITENDTGKDVTNEVLIASLAQQATELNTRLLIEVYGELYDETKKKKNSMEQAHASETGVR